MYRYHLDSGKGLKIAKIGIQSTWTSAITDRLKHKRKCREELQETWLKIKNDMESHMTRIDKQLHTTYETPKTDDKANIQEIYKEMKKLQELTMAIQKQLQEQMPIQKSLVRS